MSKPASRTMVRALVTLRYNNHLQSSTRRPSSQITTRIGRSFTRPYYSNGVSKITPLHPQPHLTQCFASKPTSLNVGLPQLFFSAKPNSSFSLSRQFSSNFKRSGAELCKKINGGFAKKVLEKPATAVSSSLSKYRGQIDASLRRVYLFLLGAGALVAFDLLWRVMFGIANFVGIPQDMVTLAFFSTMVAFGGLYICTRLAFNPKPDKLHRTAMRKLNTHAGILEAMGAPLVGTELRTYHYLLSYGGLRVQNFLPTHRRKSCFFTFPLPMQGSERNGLVSCFVEKKKGLLSCFVEKKSQYDMKLLAVDIPVASGPDQRLFLVGDEEEFKVVAEGMAAREI